MDKNDINQIINILKYPIDNSNITKKARANKANLFKLSINLKS